MAGNRKTPGRNFLPARSPESSRMPTQAGANDVASKIAQVKMPKLPALAQPGPPKPQPSVQSTIFRNNREGMRAVPMAPQRYPKFMGRTY